MSAFKRPRVLIVGCGMFGAGLASALSRQGCTVNVIDMAERAFELLDDDFDGETITGDGASSDVLEESGIFHTGYLVASTGHDATNLLIAEIATKIFGVDHVVPVVEEEALVEILEEAGVEPLCPHAICLEQFYRLSGLGPQRPAGQFAEGGLE